MINIGIKKGSQATPKTKAGLDIGSYSLKVVEIRDAASRPRLVTLGMKKVFGGSKEAVKDAIMALMKESEVSTKSLNISISGPSVVVRFISVPNMMDEELKNAIRFEAEKFIPFNINDYIVDFQILKKNEQEKRFDILLAAAKKEDVLERVDLVKSCGFSVEVVDIDGFALANSFLKNFPSLESDKTFALMNIGSALTNLSIIKGNTICLVRDMGIGGNDLNAFISKGLGIDINSVEDIKHSPRERAQEVINCSKGIINNLMDEFRLSCSYYENQCGRSIDAIYVSGGSSEFVGLDGIFEDILGSKPNHWDPIQFLDINSAGIDLERFDKPRGAFAVAAGLALR